MHVDAGGKTRPFSRFPPMQSFMLWVFPSCCLLVGRPSLATAGVSFSILCRRIGVCDSAFNKRHPAQLLVDASQPSHYFGHTSHIQRGHRGKENNGTSNFGLSHVDLQGFCSKGFCFTAEVAIGFKCYSFIAEHPCLIDLRRMTPKSTTWRHERLVSLSPILGRRVTTMFGASLLCSVAFPGQEKHLSPHIRSNLVGFVKEHQIVVRMFQNVAAGTWLV